MRAVFIGGCPRSGTTLLGSVLGSLPGAICTPESPFKAQEIAWADWSAREIDLAATWKRFRSNRKLSAWGLRKLPSQPPLPDRSYRDNLEWLVEQYARAAGEDGADVWVDHTPFNVRHVSVLNFLFPQSKYIHIVRDGRAAYASVRRLPWGPNTAARGGRWWMERMSHGLALVSRMGPERAREVRFEALVSDAAGVVRKLASWLKMEFSKDAVEGGNFRVPEYSRKQHRLVGKEIRPERTDAWREELPDREIEVFESEAHGLLELMGYESRWGTGARPEGFLEKVFARLQEVIWTHLVNRIRLQLRWWRSRWSARRAR